MASGLFVTGTDTGVGKTLIACALLQAITSAGRSSVGMKPVAAGREGGRFHDVEALVAAGSVRAPGNLVNPYAFEPPIAPHIAARQAGVAIDIVTIVHAYEALSRLADVVVVEGAGGFMIPLNAGQTSADLARELGLPVVLVVGMRLGCLNHALLTQQAIADCGLVCAGWVANCILPDMPFLEDNIGALDERIASPLLGIVPNQRDATPRQAAQHLAIAPLLRTMT
jgi:dethiobiotin synthetase